MEPLLGTYSSSEADSWALFPDPNLIPLYSVPASVKHTDSSSKATSASSKASDTWLPLPTPVPISSSRSFSELIKSEELLSSKVSQLQALLEKQQEEMAKKDSALRMMQAELEETQDQVTRTHQSWEAKCEALLSQQHEKYQDLNDRYLVVLTRARSCESKLEEMFIDPLTLQPFDRRISEQEIAETAVARQRTLLTLVEEHQSKENIDSIQSQRDLENLLRSAVNGLQTTDSDVDVLIASARTQSFLHSENSLKQLELSIPNLLSDASTEAHGVDMDSSVSDLDWSVVTTDEPGSPTRGPDDIEQALNFDSDEYLPSTSTSHSASWQIDPEMSDDPDDAFFDKSICDEQ